MFQAANPGSKLLLAGLLAGAFAGAAVAQSPPRTLDLSSGNTAWISEGTEWDAVPGGPQPVRFDPKFPYVPNNTGKQPTFRVADLSNPNLTDFAKAELKKSNDMVHSGFAMYAREARCWASGIPVYLLNPAQPTYFLQTPKKITMVWQMDQQVRHVHMDVPHSANLKPTWYGESVGRYEGDTLVIDTIGLNGKAHLDNYRTPATDKTHVVERYQLVEDGQKLEAHVTITDPTVLKQPLQVVHRWRKVNQPIIESRCADGEMNNPFEQQRVEPLPTAMRPDF
jgi:hypothetical protein